MKHFLLGHISEPRPSAGVRCALLGLVLALGTVVLPSRVAADGVIVGRFSGPRAGVLRRHVVQALEQTGVQVVEGERADAVTRSHGSSASSPSVLRELAARAYVEARVVRSRRGWDAALRVVDHRGDELLTERVSARQASGLVARVRRWARSELAEAVAELDPPVPTTPAPDERWELEERPQQRRAPLVAEFASEQEPSSSPPRSVAPIAIHAGLAVTRRSLSYNDDLFGRLRPYELPAAPVAQLELEYFPGAHFDSGAFGGFSVSVSGEYAIAVETIADNNVRYPTNLWALGATARYRLRVDDVVFRIDGGYQANVFQIDDADELSPRPAVPNVELHSLRAGAGLRWDVGLGLFFETYGAYLHPFGAGEIQSEAWFPRLDVGGVEVEGGVGFAVDDIELRGLFVMRRFFFAMNPEPGDPVVVGGAVDQYLSGVLRFTYTPSGS